MFKIEDDVIYITRGDNAAIEVAAYTDESGETPYEMQEGDSITFTVRQIASKKSTVVFSVTSVNNRIVLSHNDTANAEVGKYSADIQLDMANGERHTIWPKFKVGKPSKEYNFKNFCIMPEVTMI